MRTLCQRSRVLWRTCPRINFWGQRKGAGSGPSPSGPQKATTVGGVSRLTDTSKYTGTHKERFDESGKGKGIAGREDVTDNSGYVSGYKGAGTYDKKGSN